MANTIIWKYLVLQGVEYLYHAALKMSHVWRKLELRAKYSLEWNVYYPPTQQSFFPLLR